MFVSSELEVDRAKYKVVLQENSISFYCIRGKQWHRMSQISFQVSENRALFPGGIIEHDSLKVVRRLAGEAVRLFNDLYPHTQITGNISWRRGRQEIVSISLTQIAQRLFQKKRTPKRAAPKRQHRPRH